MTADGGDDVLRRILDGDKDAYVEVITAQAKKVIGKRLPHPEGRGWVGDDVTELVNEFYLSPAYQYSLLSSADDDELKRLVYTALLNMVRETLRHQERGRLHRRMKEILRAEGFVEGPAKFWRRPDDPTEAFAGHPTDLITAAWKVDVRVVRWRPDAKRNSPVAEGRSFIAVLDAILDAAGGAVHEDVLVETLAQRFGVGPTSYIESLDVPDEMAPPAVDPDPADVVVAADEELEAAIIASGVWSQLSPGERDVFLQLPSTARDAAAELSVAPSTANSKQRRLKDKMKVLLSDVGEDRLHAVLRELRFLAGATDS